MATGVYNHGKFLISKGLVALDTADIRVLLVSNSYVFSAAHNFVSDIPFEITGFGYLRKPLANKTLVENDVLNRIVLSADNVTWSSVNFGGIPDAAIFYVEGASDGARPLICCLDLSPKILPTAVDYVLQVSATGLLVIL